MARAILVWLLLERDGAVLLGRRRAEAPPFAGLWTLPGDLVAEEESAEEALRRFAARELGLRVEGEEFVETLYLMEGGENYVTNVFRVVSEGDLRFRAATAYEELAWVRRADVRDAAAYPMPKALRQLLAPPTDGGSAPHGVPDNRAAWDAISADYQEKHKLKTDTAHYGMRMPTERDLRLLGDVRGRRVLEIGCGGGQCAVAFAREGAVVTAIDQSEEQLRFARALAAKEGVRVEFLRGDITTLPEVRSGSQDAVFSSHALGYVEDIATCLAEVYRVLRRGGLFVFATLHPVAAMLGEGGSLTVTRAYWEEYSEWEWGEGSGVWMRDWVRSIERWFTLLREAGFTVDRILEPRMRVDAHDESWDDAFPLTQGLLAPTTLIMRAVKP
jgi:ubiquinone/menaquinone biosynthesis C-methylase UbiE/ADP-ribose pyrophosphatase YjhB (NUDIX family)